MYLFDEYPIIANKTLARELGLNEALILQQIHYWIEINKKTGKNFYEGRYWTYNSIRSWSENDFDYMSFDTVKRTFTKLEKQGYLITGNFNKDPRDKTKWYTIDEEKLEILYKQIKENKKREEIESLKNNKQDMDNLKEIEVLPNALVQNALMEKGKIHQCKSANCTNADEQNDPMHYGKMTQPLPENTTNNTTKITSYISTNPSFIPSEEKAITNQIYEYDNHENENNWKDVREDKKQKNYEQELEKLRQSSGYYSHLCVGNVREAEEFDEILKILADVMMLDKDEMITINQSKLPAYIVQERYSNLQFEHLDHLVRVIQDTEHKINNIRAFILTAAYNVFSSVDAHYTATVNYDMKHW